MVAMSVLVPHNIKQNTANCKRQAARATFFPLLKWSCKTDCATFHEHIQARQKTGAGI